MTVMSPVLLKNVRVSKIKPYTKTEHPAILESSVFDLPCMDVYVPIVFFYKPAEGQQVSAFINLVEQLKESLSKVLVPYFPMAGNWVRTYDSRIRELDCNDAGVTFIEAAIDEKLESVVRLNEFETTDLLAGHRFVGLDPKLFHQDFDSPLPSLFVQVTQFKCGSVALNVTFCHMTADGKGMFTFLEAWSQIALHGQTSIAPVHDRSLTPSVVEFIKIARGDKSGEDSTLAGFMKFAEGDAGGEDVGTKKVHTKKRRVDPRKATRNKTLHVRRQVIDDLKREAALQDIKVSTLDLISAHLCRSLSKLPESIDGMISSMVVTAMEGRSKCRDPPLPEHYSGNVVLTACTPPVAASDLAAGNSTLFAADIIHNTLKAITSSNWQRCVPGVSRELKDFPNLNCRMLMVTSWLRFPMYEISFGHGFGKPILASSNWYSGLISAGSVHAIVQPPPPALAGAAMASIHFTLVPTSDPAGPQSLFSDEQFLSLFLPFPNLESQLWTPSFDSMALQTADVSRLISFVGPGV